MSRAYTVATAALALKVGPKWIDNALSHHSVPGVVQERQGVRRRLSEEALLILAIALHLIDNLGATLAHALPIAHSLARLGHHSASNELSISIDLTTIRAQLQARLEAAIEVAPVPRRGRPPKQTGRLD